MIRGIIWTHIQSAWNHSGPSEVPYVFRKPVTGDELFFCFLQQTGSKNYYGSINIILNSFHIIYNYILCSIRLKLFAILFLAKDYAVVDIILVTLQFQIQANLDSRILFMFIDVIENNFTFHFNLLSMWLSILLTGSKIQYEWIQNFTKLNNLQTFKDH